MGLTYPFPECLASTPELQWAVCVMFEFRHTSDDTRGRPWLHARQRDNVQAFVTCFVALTRERLSTGIGVAPKEKL